MAFSLHCVFASFLGLVQIAMYEKGGQKVEYNIKLTLAVAEMVSKASGADCLTGS